MGVARGHNSGEETATSIWRVLAAMAASAGLKEQARQLSERALAMGGLRDILDRGRGGPAADAGATFDDPLLRVKSLPELILLILLVSCRGGRSDWSSACFQVTPRAHR